MRVLMQLWRACLALAVLCPLAGLRAQDVFIQVPVELGGTATRMTLPFGEPFLLVGVAPEQLKLVDARFVVDELPTADRCDVLLADTSRAARAPVRPWVRNARVKSDSFAVLVNSGLRANRRYGFCMQTRSALDSAGLSRFQRRAYEVLDTTYRAQSDSSTDPPALSSADVALLQRRLARALPTEQGRPHTQGTIFDTTGVKVTEEDLVFTGDVLTSQRNRFHAGRSLTAGRDMARLRLAQLSGDRVLRAIAGTVTRGDRIAGMDSATVERVVETARLLAFPDPPLLLAISGGAAVLAPSAMPDPRPLAPHQVTDPAEMAVRAARLDSTYQRLLELRDFTAALGVSRALQRRTGVTPLRAASLRQSLDQVRQTLDQMRRFSAAWLHADAQRRSLLVNAARTLRVEVTDRVPVVSTTISNFETRARQYVTADLGLAYTPGLGEAAPYFGANFYFGAINKRVPLAVAQPSEWERWSATVGVTATSFAKQNARENLFGSFSLLVGAGRRMTDPIRMTGGAIVYRRLNVNPLVDDSSIALSPFLSLSFDFDARSALGRVGETLFR